MSLTLVLIIVTCLISYQAFNNRSMFEQLLHSPYREAHSKEYYRFLTSGFVHGSPMHLLINMYVLYMFGQAVEYYLLQEFGPLMGRINFLVIYLLTIIFGDLPTFIKHRNNAYFSSVGASGAISGILMVFILFNPWAELLLFFIIPMPAILAGILFLVYSSWASKNTNDRIDHEAHFYGAVFGCLLCLVMKPSIFAEFLQRFQAGWPF
ncbi:MAG: rhomboid family intramembrane serine protease [Bacteroidota bacterium]